MKKRWVIVLLAGIWFLAGPGVVAQENGAANMVLHGGTPGDVPFPHEAHQSALGDCNVCHHLFPQAPGSIEKLKAEGKLKGKDAMAECIGCHQQKGGDGEGGPPLKCSGCHRK